MEIKNTFDVRKEIYKKDGYNLIKEKKKVNNFQVEIN